MHGEIFFLKMTIVGIRLVCMMDGLREEAGRRGVEKILLDWYGCVCDEFVSCDRFDRWVKWSHFVINLG